MYIPEFKIELNKELDEAQFIEFFESGSSLITKQFPQIKSTENVRTAIDYVYSHQEEHIGRGLKILNDNIETLRALAEVISEKIDCKWDGISTITINPCSFPICPRFIEDNSFMVAYFFNKDAILGICAHEMIHLLYFKKLKDTLPNENILTEYPSVEWLLSEIYAPFITNSSEVQKLINFKDSLFIPDDIEVNEEKLEKVKELYLKNQNLAIFRDKALEVLQY